MNTQLENNYKEPGEERINSEDKAQIWLFIKRFIKVLVVILAIKIIRRILIKNEEAYGVVKEIFSIGNTEVALTNLVITMLVVMLTLYISGIVYLGKKIIYNRFFTAVLMFSIVDAIMILAFPEVTIATLKALIQIE